ncbi:hypothetical protein ACQKH5_15205 [Hyphomonas sp. NPDC076900]|uniref:hypothetical protein n=1 Tax=unclassified Hyphomonas TaxID=2630699 RepID=UPI003D060BAA
MRLAFPAVFLLILLPVTAVVALYAWWIWPHTGYLTELTLSGAAYGDQNKMRDVFLVPGFLGMGVIAAAMLWLVLKFAAATSPASPDGEARLATMGRAGTILLLVLLAASGAIGWAVLAGTGLCILVSQMRLQDAWDRGAGIMVLFACALALLLENTLQIDPDVVLPLTLIGGAVLLWFLPHPAWLARLLFKLSAVLVAAAIVLAAPVFWQPVNGRGALVTFVDLPFFLVGGLIVKAALFDGGARGTNGGWPSEAGLALALAAAFTLLQMQEFGLPVVPNDDYHFGEYLIGADWSAQGLLFSEGFPAHGLFDAIGGIIARQRGEDSATAILLGFAIFAFFCKFAILHALLRLFGLPLGLIGFIIVLPMVQPNRLGEVAIVAVLAAAGARSSPVMAGILTVGVAALSVFTFGGAGIVLAVTGFSIALVAQYRRDPRQFRSYLATALAAGLVIVAIAHQAVLGWLWYLLESSRTNVLLYGLGLETWLSQSSDWIEFGFAHAFAVIPFLGIGLLVLFSPRVSGSWRQFAGLIAAVLPLLAGALLWNSYAMGRIDPGYARAALVSVTMGATFACWAAVIAPPAARGVAAALAALIIMPVGSGLYDFRQPLAPNNVALPAAPQGGLAEHFRIGAGAFSQPSLDRLQNIEAVLEDVGLQPGEAFGNLTNRSAINYYLDRPLPLVLTSAYNAGTRTFQTVSLNSWYSAPPKIFLISAENLEHDGYKLPARAFEFYRYVVEEDYSPLVANGMVFAVHNSSLGVGVGAQKQVFGLLDVTDVNWTQGLANELNTGWSMAVEERARGVLAVGDQLQVSDGSIRTVVNADGLNVKLDNDDFAGAEGRSLTFSVLNREVPLDPEMVLAGTFRLENLNRWPSALGRSMALLREHSIDDAAPIALNLVQTLDATGAPVLAASGERGINAGTTFVFRAGKPFAPDEAGLLDIELRCTQGAGAPFWRVSWSRPAEPANPIATIHFVSSYFRNLVPLDTNANWLLSDAIEEIRLELLDMGGCASVTVENARLIGRKPLDLAH